MRFSVKVPATTANLGSGFDTAGIALTLYNTFTFDFTKKSDQTFHDPTYSFDSSLTLDTFNDVLIDYSVPRPPVHLETHSMIPIARGLGSSSTCIVAGILAANYYAKLQLSKEKMAHIASIIEGHPDNVIPAIFGNLCLTVADPRSFVSHTIKVHSDLSFIALYPNTPVSTQEARSQLPQLYQIGDVVYSLSRASLLAPAFEQGDVRLLQTATQDMIHEPYRQEQIKNYAAITQALQIPDIITHWISGSGPTIIALVNKSEIQNCCNRLSTELKETILPLEVDLQGAVIDEL